MKSFAAIRELDPDARLLYSQYTGKFYVESRAIHEGSIPPGLIGSVTEHRKEPESAVDAFWHRITSIPRLIVEHGGVRRELTWNPVYQSFVPYGSVIDATHLVE